MATWQFDIDLLSRKKLLTMFGEVPSTLNEGMVDAAASWREQPLPPDWEGSLSKLLPEARSWSSDIRLWGQESGNRISLMHDDAGYPEEISVRIDARTRHDQFLEGVVGFAKCIDAVLLVVETLEIIESAFDLLVTRMNQSNASRFVDDPNNFLESIKDGKIKIRRFQ